VGKMNGDEIDDKKNKEKLKFKFKTRNKAAR
jgi:hypothetical protein